MWNVAGRSALLALHGEMGSNCDERADTAESTAKSAAVVAGFSRCLSGGELLDSAKPRWDSNNGPGGVKANAVPRALARLMLSQF